MLLTWAMPMRYTNRQCYYYYCVTPPHVQVHFDDEYLDQANADSFATATEAEQAYHDELVVHSTQKSASGNDDSTLHVDAGDSSAAVGNPESPVTNERINGGRNTEPLPDGVVQNIFSSLAAPPSANCPPNPREPPTKHLRLASTDLPSTNNDVGKSATEDDKTKSFGKL